MSNLMRCTMANRTGETREKKWRNNRLAERKVYQKREIRAGKHPPQGRFSYWNYGPAVRHLFAYKCFINIVTLNPLHRNVKRLVVDKVIKCRLKIRLFRINRFVLDELIKYKTLSSGKLFFFFFFTNLLINH